MDQKKPNKQAGFALSSELLLAITLLSIGLIVGLASLRNATLAELEDFAEAFGGTNQSFICPGLEHTEPGAATAGCLYSDGVDTGDGDPLTASSGPGGDLRYFSSTPAAAELPPVPVFTSIFTADFNNLVGGNFNGGQFQSGLTVAYAGAIPGWIASGGNAVHAVDHANVHPSTANPRDFAVMFWTDNSLLSDAPIPGSNNLGDTYVVDFLASPAVYQAGSQATGAGEGVLFEVIRADNSVLASYTHQPGAWAGDTVLTAGQFQYTGDGSGDIRIRISSSPFGSGRFGGAIDNLTVSIANP